MLAGVVTDRHNSSASLNSAAMAAASGGSASGGSDDNDGIPPGWTRKESKTQKGRYYYISPAGKTQWTAPVTKATPKKGSPTDKCAFSIATGNRIAQAREFDSYTLDCMMPFQ